MSEYDEPFETERWNDPSESDPPDSPESEASPVTDEVPFHVPRD